MGKEGWVSAWAGAAPASMNVAKFATTRMMMIAQRCQRNEARNVLGGNVSMDVLLFHGVLCCIPETMGTRSRMVLLSERFWIGRKKLAVSRQQNSCQRMEIRA